MPKFLHLYKEDIPNLVAILMDRPHLKQYDRMVQFDKNETIAQQSKDGAKIPRKINVFRNYKSPISATISSHSEPMPGWIFYYF